MQEAGPIHFVQAVASPGMQFPGPYDVSRVTAQSATPHSAPAQTGRLFARSVHSEHTKYQPINRSVTRTVNSAWMVMRDPAPDPSAGVGKSGEAGMRKAGGPDNAKRRLSFESAFCVVRSSRLREGVRGRPDCPGAQVRMHARHLKIARLPKCGLGTPGTIPVLPPSGGGQGEGRCDARPSNPVTPGAKQTPPPVVTSGHHVHRRNASRR
jgi:hypothetical protein